MDQKQMLKQLLDFNRSAFNNAFNAMIVLQEQAERVTGTLLDQATWLPAEGRKTITDWVAACKKGRDDFKNLVDDNYKRVEQFFASAE